MSKAPKKFHIAYEFDGEKIEVGDQVVTLCGKMKKVREPDYTVPICGPCFKEFSDDSRRTGAANDILMQVLQSIADSLNDGRKKYLEQIAGEVLIGGGELDREAASIG